VKILFVTGEFPPMQGGVGDYTREIALALYEQGCEVHVLTSTQAGPMEGLTVDPIVKDWNWDCWGTVLDLVDRHQPDVVHIQYQAAAYAMHPAINLLPRRLARLGTGRPRTVVTFHDLRVPYLFPKAGPVRRWIVNELARRSDAAITTNREDFENLKRALGAGEPDVSLIPIGSNITPQLPDDFERDAWRARWGAGAGDLLLCFFGFINDRKGVDTLLRALHLLALEPESPSRPLLLFVGGRTGASDPTNVAYLAQVEQMIADLGLGEQVRWTGYVSPEEVSAGFLAADLCVLPFRDGVSFLHGTLHAALAHAVPILTTQPRVTLPELVHGENVYLVPPVDPQALAGAIAELARTPDLRRGMATGAGALAELFHWDRIAADTIELYRTIGAGQPSP
jgi:glycosyltransferase involved in cell wall biosynthesis